MITVMVILMIIVIIITMIVIKIRMIPIKQEITRNRVVFVKILNPKKMKILPILSERK